MDKKTLKTIDLHIIEIAVNAIIILIAIVVFCAIVNWFSLTFYHKSPNLIILLVAGLLSAYLLLNGVFKIWVRIEE